MLLLNFVPEVFEVFRIDIPQIGACSPFEIFKCNHDRCDVVQCFGVNTLVQAFVDGKASLLVDADRSPRLKGILINILTQDLVAVKVTAGSIPHRFDDGIVVKFLENTIAAKHNKVVVWPDLEGFDLWVGNDALGIASVSRVLGFDVADGARDREAAREDSVRTDDHLEARSIVWGRIGNIALVLVDLATAGLNTLRLVIFLWFVVLREHEDLLAAIS